MFMITLHHTSGRTPSGNVSTHGTSGAEPSRYADTSGVSWHLSGWLLLARGTSDVETSGWLAWVCLYDYTACQVLTLNCRSATHGNGCSSRTSRGQEYNSSVCCSYRQHDLVTSDNFGVTLFSPRRQSKFEIRIFATREGHTGFNLGFRYVCVCTFSLDPLF